MTLPEHLLQASHCPKCFIWRNSLKLPNSLRRQVESLAPFSDSKYISSNMGYHAYAVMSCPTLCNLMDCNPPGSSVHGIISGKNTGVGCHFPPLGNLLTQGLNPCLLGVSCFAGEFFTWGFTREALLSLWQRIKSQDNFLPNSSPLSPNKA